MTADLYIKLNFEFFHHFMIIFKNHKMKLFLIAPKIASSRRTGMTMRRA